MNQQRQLWVNAALVLVALIAVNLLAASLYFRFDITSERLYTLSHGTKSLLQGLQKPVTLKFFFSNDAPGVPLTYKTYGAKVQELLEEYRAEGSTNFQLEVYNPQPDSDEEEWATRYGLSGADLGGGMQFFMGLVAVQEDKEAVIALLDPRREQYLEYDLSQLLLQVARAGDKKIGVFSSLQVFGQRQSPMAPAGENGPWVLISELEKTFEVAEVENLTQLDPKTMPNLMLLHPKAISEEEQKNLDQYLMQGGNLLLLLDPKARVDREAAMAARFGAGGNAASDLPQLLPAWGIEYHANLLVGDPLHAARVTAQGIGVIPFSLWHQLTPSSFNQDLIATKELENMLLPEPGSFRLAQGSKLTLTPLITASAEAGTLESYLNPFTSALELNEKVRPDGQTHVLAGLISGPIPSAFGAKGEHPGKILLIADVDFISDDFSVDRFAMLGQVVLQPKNDNLAFMLNLVEFMGGADELMEIRSRGRFQRPFTRFEELERQAQTSYRQAESGLENKLQELQERLKNLDAQAQGGKVVLSKDQILRIQQFRNEEKQTKAKLREIRKLLRSDIETEKTWLILLNLLSVPLVLVMAGIWFFRRRVLKPREA